MMTKVYIYGLDSEYRVIRYAVLNVTDVTIRNLHFEAEWLKSNHAGITHVYACDNTEEVTRAYFAAKRDTGIEERVMFKLLLDEQGIKLV